MSLKYIDIYRVSQIYIDIHRVSQIYIDIYKVSQINIVIHVSQIHLVRDIVLVSQIFRYMYTISGFLPDICSGKELFGNLVNPLNSRFTSTIIE